MWTKLMFDVETFIEAVKERPALYNPKHEHYNRKDVRARLWDEIGEIMYSDWESFDFRDKNEKGSIMQRKWKSLKDCFNREIRWQKNLCSNKVRKKYEFYDKLSFLLLKNNVTSTIQTLPVKEVRIKVEKLGNPDANASTQSTPQPCQLTYAEQNRNENRTLEGNARKRKAKNESESSEGPKLKQKKKNEEDGDRLFLISFLNDLKKLPLATKYWVKMKFSEIMHQAAMSLDGCQDVEYASTSLEYEQDIDSPAFAYTVDDPAEGSSPDSSSSEMYDICKE